MQPSLNYRQSRRSACDRCRGFKLRCERDQTHGRSCERCLKAQVMCTTSINHPGSNYASSKNRSCSFPVECDPRFMNPNRLAMPVLHKHAVSKVKKTISPGNMRNHENSALNGWPYQDPFPSWSSGDMSSFGGDIDLHMSSYPTTSFPFEQWGEPLDPSPWMSNLYQASPVEDLFLEPNYGLDRRMSTSESFIPQPTYAFPDEIPSSNIPALPSQSLSLLGKDDSTLPGTDYNWTSSWLQGPETSDIEERQVESALEWSPIPYDLRKKMLKLNLEMIESLESVEAVCGVMRFSPLMPDDIISSLSKLDLPIIRVLNHSTQFLEMLPVGSGADESLSHLIPSIEFPQTALDSFQDTKPLSLDSAESSLEEGPTTAASHDSGYHTIFSAPSNHGRFVSTTKCDTPTALSLLMTFVQLTRTYRVIFSQLHQTLLVMSPADTASPFLLPSLQFGQFHSETRLDMQLHSILNLSSDVLGKIERALGISYPPLQDNGDAGSGMSILDSGLLASIRDNVVAQEQIDFGVSLKDTMDCLRRLLSD